MPKIWGYTQHSEAGSESKVRNDLGQETFLGFQRVFCCKFGKFFGFFLSTFACDESADDPQDYHTIKYTLMNSSCLVKAKSSAPEAPSILPKAGWTGWAAAYLS